MLYVAARAFLLKIHVKSKHQGVMYLLTGCEQAESSAGDLKIHVENKQKSVG